MSTGGARLTTGDGLIATVPSRPNRAWAAIADWRVPEGTSRDALALATIGAAVLLLYGPLVLQGRVFFENDSFDFYYPLLSFLGDSLRDGRLPLWTPDIFAGFPLFADGEIGALYPLHWLALLLMPAEVAFAWLPVIRTFLAGSFLFLFARVLGLERPASLIAGLTFALGGFMVAQLHHANVVNSALLLPLVFALVELALRKTGRLRLRYALLAGLAVACQFFGFHVQPVILTVLGLAVYTGFRLSMQRPPSSSHRFGRFVGTLTRHTIEGAIMVAGIAGVGLALAAVQVIPLLELSTFSFRGRGVTYEYATSFAVTPYNLVTLVVPYFFRGPDGQYWDHWVRWETAIYAGLPALVLTVFALTSRRREVWFFAGLAIVSLTLALGDYGPPRLYWLIWHLPGFSYLRAPGRFGLLELFAFAMLAGFGAQRLLDARVTERGLRAPLILLSVLIPTAVLAATLCYFWLSLDRATALRLIDDWYLSLRSDVVGLTSARVYDYLRYALSPLSPHLARAALIGSATLLLIWWWLRRSGSANGLAIGLTLLTAVDLLTFASAFHPSLPLERITTVPAIARYLDQQPGLFRIYTLPSAPELRPNRLLPHDVPEAGGYSSLGPDRVSDFARLSQYGHNRLLDLWNVVYLVSGQGTTTHAGLRFDHRSPLTRLAPERGYDRVELAPDSQAVTEIRIIGATMNAEARPGDVIAEVVAVLADGSERSFPITGRTIGPARPPSDRERAETGAALQVWQKDDDVRWRQTSLHEARFRLGRPSWARESLPLHSLELRAFLPRGELHVYGVGLVDDTGVVRPIRSLAGRRVVYNDLNLMAVRNSSALGRAFLTGGATVCDSDGAARSWLAAAGFDPAATVILEPGEAQPRPAESPPHRIEGGVVAIDDYDLAHVALNVQTPEAAWLVVADSYYPGWRAKVDGQAAELYLANYLFRAVRVPAGEHRVELRFEPDTVRVGGALSLASGLAVALGLLATSYTLRSSRRSLMTVMRKKRPPRAPSIVK
ncbi:MAG: YfhO family protein [Chloroflexi bacterium]|nr:YfhO family protein [Chloroflexota bacterium]